MPKKIKVILVDDHKLVRAGLRSLIEDNTDMEVTAEMSNGQEMLHKAMDLKFDVAVVDITMPGMDGLELVAKLKSILPNSKVIVLSMHEAEYFVVHALEQGADGYVTKGSAPDDLVSSIRKVYSGGRYLSEKAYELLAYRVTLDSKELNPISKLSAREKQILVGLAQGLTVRGLAKKHGISPKTVNTYRTRLMEKLALKNNVEMALFALRNGLMEL